MKHIYQISGMTGAECRSNVENALNGIDGVKASVSLSPPLATIEMMKHIPTEQLQEVIASMGKYTITMV